MIDYLRPIISSYHHRYHLFFIFVMFINRRLKDYTICDYTILLKKTLPIRHWARAHFLSVYYHNDYCITIIFYFLYMGFQRFTYCFPTQLFTYNINESNKCQSDNSRLVPWIKFLLYAINSSSILTVICFLFLLYAFLYSSILSF